MWKGSLEGLRLQRIGNKARRNHWFGKSAQNVAIFLARKMGFLSKKDFAGLLSTYTAVLICVEYILNFGKIFDFHEKLVLIDNTIKCCIPIERSPLVRCG